jgi:ParB family transcriptional regulator, chromosome partitioning protein
MEYKTIKTTEIKQGYNPRQQIENIQLRESIKQHGILVPLLVRKKDDQYEIISGNCRLREAKEVGLKELPCTIKDLSDEESANISYIDNKERNNLSAMEEAKHYAYMRDTYGYSAQQLADKYNTSRQDVDRLWQISKLSNMPNVGQLGKIHLYELSKMLDKDKLIKVFEEGFVKSKEEWNDEQNKRFEDELKYRENIQRDLANKIIENEYTVKETERLVRDCNVRFETRDENIKKEEEGRINEIISKFTSGVSNISNTGIQFEKDTLNFLNISSMIGDDFLSVVTEDKKERLIEELEDLKKVYSKIDKESVLEEIESLEKKLGGQ